MTTREEHRETRKFVPNLPKVDPFDVLQARIDSVLQRVKR